MVFCHFYSQLENKKGRNMPEILKIMIQKEI